MMALAGTLISGYAGSLELYSRRAMGVGVGGRKGSEGVGPSMEVVGRCELHSETSNQTLNIPQPKNARRCVCVCVLVCVCACIHF
jgi:hypothetical protein